MATRVTFTHVEALFPQVPAGDARLFNVPASIELFTGVLCFYRYQAVDRPKQEQGSTTTKGLKKWILNSESAPDVHGPTANSCAASRLSVKLHRTDSLKAHYSG